jgi:hypothetical protein
MTRSELTRGDDHELTVHGLSRRDFLRILGAAGVGAAASGPAALLAPGRAGAQAPPGPPDIAPTDLAFAIRAQYRPFEIVADELVELDDPFDTRDPGYRRLAPGPELNAGTVRRGRGSLSVSGESFFALFRAPTGPVAPYAAVEVRVTSFSGAAESTEDTVVAGLVRDARNSVTASYNRATGLLSIDVVRAGRRSRLNEATVQLAAPFTFAVVLNENLVTALADTGQGYVPLLRSSVRSEIDLRDPAVLRRYRFGFGVRATTGTIVLDWVRAGYWGKAGVRDPHVVTYADGTPYIQDGKLYLTLTNAGLGFFQAAHWGVYTLDLTRYAEEGALQEVGKIFWLREGRLLGDHAGHIVYDEELGAFRVAVSTWGDFTGNGVRINYAEFRGDLLHGVSVIRNPDVLPLPTELSRWDPHMVRIDGRWWVAFVESPSQTPFNFHPALARARLGNRLAGFTLVGADTTRTMTEGMVMQKIGGTWYVFCSSSRAEGPEGGRYRIYDLGMNFVGFLNAPYPTNIPHPMVTPIPVPDAGGSTKYLMVTFNGTQYYEPVLGYGTHGDFYVMEAQTVPGYEFAPRTAAPRVRALRRRAG